jgi:O-antigen/teichoic acid export membrane protein
LKLVKTSLFSAIITFIRIASGFVAGKVVALFVGPAGVAVIGQFSNFITIALTFANGAINTGVVKYTAEYDDNDKAQLKSLLSTSLKISIYCSAAFGVVLVFGASFLSDWLFDTVTFINPLRVLGCTIILYSLNSLLISILNGLKQISTYTIVNIVGSLVSLVVTVILVVHYKVQGALYSLVLSQSIVFFVTLFLVMRSDWFNWSYFNQKFDKEIAIKLGKFSLMAVVTTLTSPVSQIMLRNMVVDRFGVNSAGYWQGMMRVSDGYLLLITTSLSTYYLPKLSSLQTNGALRKEIFSGYKIIIPAVFLSCILIFFSRFLIINLLFSNAFIPMAPLFVYQLLGDFFKIASWILAYLMLAKAMTRVFIISEVVFTLSYVGFAFVFTKYWGLQGITIAFMINYLLYFISMLFIFKRLLFGGKLTAAEKF